MGEIIALAEITDRTDFCSIFVKEFLDDIYLGNVEFTKTFAHQHPEAKNRTSIPEVSHTPTFCVMKGFKKIVSVIFYVDDEAYGKMVPDEKAKEFERFARRLGVWKDMSSKSFEEDLCAHLGRKSAEMGRMEREIKFLETKIRSLEKRYQISFRWANAPRDFLDGKSFKSVEAEHRLIIKNAKPPQSSYSNKRLASEETQKLSENGVKKT